MLEPDWRPVARLQLDATIQYVRDRNESAAERLEQAFHASVERLCLMPFIGRPGRIKGTREWIVHPNYLLIYRVSDDAITVLRVLHARQRYP